MCVSDKKIIEAVLAVARTSEQGFRVSQIRCCACNNRCNGKVALPNGETISCCNDIIGKIEEILSHMVMMSGMLGAGGNIGHIAAYVKDDMVVVSENVGISEGGHFHVVDTREFPRRVAYHKDLILKIDHAKTLEGEDAPEETKAKIRAKLLGYPMPTKPTTWFGSVLEFFDVLPNDGSTAIAL